MKQNETIKAKKKAIIYNCEKCDYSTSKISNYKAHLLTTKHINETEMKQKKANINQCICCEQVFNSRTTLWRHKKNCYIKPDDDNIKDIPPNKNEEDISNKELITYLMKQNAELIEVIKSGTHHTTNNITNNKNKTFNLNFFLNETCKDAINITDFVSSIELQIKDLENTAKEGYIDGISNIIIKQLKSLDVNKRPIHCSDVKRETLYIKDNDAWEKENEQKNKMKKAIKEISNKNIKQLPNWMSKHPHHKEYNHPDNDDYLNIITTCMAGDNIEEDINKIITNISKEVIINK